MGKAVKTKKELDENKRAWESTTLKIGLVSSNCFFKQKIRKEN